RHRSGPRPSDWRGGARQDCGDPRVLSLMKRRYFGTDGVRGPYGGPIINESFAARLGFAAGRWAGGRGLALVGRDSRASGEPLAAAVAAGLRASGVEPVMLGILPTPAVARAVRTDGAVLGVVVTASHNPAADNGIKFFTGTGTKLTDTDELEIEAALPEQAADVVAQPRFEPGAEADYIAAMAAQLPAGSLSGWRIVLDTANGATAKTSATVLRELGADIVA